MTKARNQKAPAVELPPDLAAAAEAAARTAAADIAAAEEAARDRRDQAAAAARRAAGFSTPMFVAYRALAAALARASNHGPWAPETAPLAHALGARFEVEMTRRTKASARGGKTAAMVTIIHGGQAAVAALDALQERIEYWQRVEASADSSEEGRAARETARRYTQLPRRCPPVHGGPVSWADDQGRTVTATHYGRPPRTIHVGNVVVEIPYAGATDRHAQAASFLSLVKRHGSAVIDPRVIDAWLDNGGRVRAEDSPGAALAKAAAAVRAAIEAGAVPETFRARAEAALAILEAVAAASGEAAAPIDDRAAEWVGAPEAAPEAAEAAPEAAPEAAAEAAEAAEAAAGKRRRKGGM
ncbi:MAG: hypothetical protein N2Z67_10805 [Acetobacteraceae bacterium]|nr:hypothetical protein [Acetobacteraceae bacterium]